MDRTLGPLMKPGCRTNLLAATNPGSRKYREHSSPPFPADAGHPNLHWYRANVGRRPIWYRLYRDAAVRSLKL
jgi:hypothetical protein